MVAKDYRLGRKPTKHDYRTLFLSDYLDLEALPPIPATFSNVDKVRVWPMYGNDRLGDCTFAAAGHMIQAWTAAVGAPKTPSEKDIENAYFNTGDGTDDGREELEVLNYWRKTGVGPDKIGAFVALDPTNVAQVKAAIYLFGGVYTGIGMPVTAQDQTDRGGPWDVVGDGKTGDSEPWSWGGHAVPYSAYDPSGVTVVTWGELIKATWGFHHAYTEEVYALLSPDWFDASGKTIAGFNLAQLTQDLKDIVNQPVPDPTPTPTPLTNEQLLEAAVVELKLTTVGYLNKHWSFPPDQTHWDNALDLLAQMKF